jgi:DNA invertase Pin-like site-specific DNA recombinase
LFFGYLRVSTSEQTTKNQRRELEAVAERHGWLVTDYVRLLAEETEKCAKVVKAAALKSD